MSVWPSNVRALITMPVRYSTFCFVFCLWTPSPVVVWLLKGLLNLSFFVQVLVATGCLSGSAGICCMDSWLQADLVLAWCWEGNWQACACARRSLHPGRNTCKEALRLLQSLLFLCDAC